MNWSMAIDQSTASTKVLALDEQLQIFDTDSRDHQQICPQPGWVEHDAEAIWQNVLALVQSQCQRHHQRGLPQFVSLTNQRETIVVFDRASGRPLHHALVWQCVRGAPLCSRLVEQGLADTVAHKTGLKIDTYFSASKVAWLMEHRPELAAQVRSGQALVGTIDSYLIYRMTSGRVFATDHTNASRTLLFDVRRLCWDEALCDLFHVPVHALPEVRESTSRFGTTNGSLPSGIPICGVMGDSQAALFAQHCFHKGSAKATFGTGTSVMLNTEDHFSASAGGSVTALAWVLGGQRTYAIEGLINYSAATIAWLKNRLELIDHPSETEALANSVSDSGGVYLVPAFAGLGAPYWQPDARAAIVGMSAYTTRAHVVRAALESIAYQVRDVLEMMRTTAGIEWDSICADGGATANRFLMQFIADICRVEIRVSTVADLSARGAAELGWLGHHESSDPATLIARTNSSATHETYLPQMSADQANHLVAGWAQAVQRVL